jgi:NAD+ kinase
MKEIMLDEIEMITARMIEAEVFDHQGELLRVDKAFNEFYFERSSSQMAHLKVGVNGKTRFHPLFADGIIVSTPAGSTAYNAAAGGQVLPVENKAIVLTGICPAVFHHWRSSILPGDSVIEIEVVESKKRPVRLLADGIKIPRAARIIVRSSDSSVRLGFVRSQDFREKILRLQFC